MPENYLTWDEVVETPDYQKLSPLRRRELADEYYDNVVKPKVPKMDWEPAKAEFDEYVSPSLAVLEPEPVTLSSEPVKPELKDIQRPDVDHETMRLNQADRATTSIYGQTTPTGEPYTPSILEQEDEELKRLGDWREAEQRKIESYETPHEKERMAQYERAETPGHEAERLKQYDRRMVSEIQPLVTGKEGAKEVAYLVGKFMKNRNESLIRRYKSMGMYEDAAKLEEYNATDPIYKTVEQIKPKDLGDMKGYKRVVRDVIKLGPQFVSQMILTAMNPLAGAGFMGAQIQAGSEEQLKAEGAAPERAERAAFSNAAAQAALESVGALSVLKFMKPVKGFAGKGLHVLEAGLSEFATEFLQSYPDLAAEIWAMSPGKTPEEKYKQFAEAMWETDFLKDAAYQGFIGMLAGGGMAAGGQTFGSILKKLGDGGPGEIQEKLTRLTPEQKQKIIEFEMGKIESTSNMVREGIDTGQYTVDEVKQTRANLPAGSSEAIAIDNVLSEMGETIPTEPAQAETVAEPTEISPAVETGTMPQEVAPQETAERAPEAEKGVPLEPIRTPEEFEALEAQEMAEAYPGRTTPEQRQEMIEQEMGETPVAKEAKPLQKPYHTENTNKLYEKYGNRNDNITQLTDRTKANESLYSEVTDPKKREKIQKRFKDRLLGDYGTVKFDDVHEAMDDFEDNGIPYIYERTDGRNLGGRNKEHGNVHDKTDEDLKKIWGEVYTEEARKYGAVVGRDQGDEFITLWPNFTLEEVSEIRADIDKQVMARVKELGAENTPHPKHDNMPTGSLGLDYGLVEVTGKRGETDRLADKAMAKMKDRFLLDKAKESGYIYDEQGDKYVRPKTEQEARVTKERRPETEIGTPSERVERPEGEGRTPRNVERVEKPEQITPTEQPTGKGAVEAEVEAAPKPIESKEPTKKERTPRSQRVPGEKPQATDSASLASQEKLPQDSPYKQEKYSLVKVEKKVNIRSNADPETRVYEVSVQPKELAKYKDKESNININTLKKARGINANPERVKDWQKIYSKATKIDKFGGVKKVNKNGKLADVPVVSLTKGCQRTRTIIERTENGVMPEETRIEACYGGDCWVNRQFNRVFGTFENMEVRDLQIANAEQIDKWLSNEKTREWLDSGYFIRQGQQGDDSHLFASGVALEWMKAVDKHGIKNKTVFISASYAPVTTEQYKALKPYADKFEIHFSNSGWFHKNEIMIRLAEFKAAKDAGLNVSIRLVTNVDKIAGIEMSNEKFIRDQMKKMGVRQDEVLETPFHDDAIKKGQKRSEPTGDYKYICCETGVCKSCPVKCMTKVDGRASVNTSFQLKDNPNYSPGEVTDTYFNGEPYTLDQIKNLYKNQDVQIAPDGSIAITVKSGQGVNIRTAETITPDKVAIEAGYGKMMQNGELIAGKYKDKTITISRNVGDIWTVSHETLHWMEDPDTGIVTERDQRILSNKIKKLHSQGKWETQNKKDIGGSEDRAVYVTEQLKTRSEKGTIGKIIQKIADFIDGIVNLAGVKTARGLVREIESGKIFERKMSPETKAEIRKLDEEYQALRILRDCAL